MCILHRADEITNKLLLLLLFGCLYYYTVLYLYQNFLSQVLKLRFWAVLGCVYFTSEVKHMDYEQPYM